MQSDISSKISSNYIKNYDLQLSIHNISMNFALFCGHFYMGDIRNNDSIIKKMNVLNYRCNQMSVANFHQIILKIMTYSLVFTTFL